MNTKSFIWPLADIEIIHRSPIPDILYHRDLPIVHKDLPGHLIWEKEGTVRASFEILLTRNDWRCFGCDHLADFVHDFGLCLNRDFELLVGQCPAMSNHSLAACFRWYRPRTQHDRRREHFNEMSFFRKKALLCIVLTGLRPLWDERVLTLHLFVRLHLVSVGRTARGHARSSSVRADPFYLNDVIR